MQTVKLTVDNKTIIRVMAVGFAFVVGLNALGVLGNVLKLIAVAVFLSIALNPMVNYFSKKFTGGRRAVAAALSYVIMLFTFGLILALVIPSFARDTAGFVDRLPTYVEDLRQSQGFIPSLIRDLRIDEQLDDLAHNFTDYITPASESLLSGLGVIGNFVFSLITILVLAFFLLLEGPQWFKHFWQTQPKVRAERYKVLARRVYGVITDYVNEQLLLAVIGGFAAYIVLQIASIPFALPLAALVGVFGLVPLIGPVLAAVIVTSFAWISSIYAALFMLVFFLVYGQIERYIIKPTFKAEGLSVSPLLVLIAVIFGASLGGLLGALTAIPIAASARTIFLDFYNRKQLKS